MDILLIGGPPGTDVQEFARYIHQYEIEPTRPSVILDIKDYEERHKYPDHLIIIADTLALRLEGRYKIYIESSPDDAICRLMARYGDFEEVMRIRNQEIVYEATETRRLADIWIPYSRGQKISELVGMDFLCSKIKKMS